MNDAPFKPGDRVRCVDNSNREEHLVKGGVYKVKECSDALGEWFVKIDGNSSDFFEHRFQKAEDAPAPTVSGPTRYRKASDFFVVGDTVEFVHTSWPKLVGKTDCVEYVGRTYASSEEWVRVRELHGEYENSESGRSWPPECFGIRDSDGNLTTWRDVYKP